MSGDNWCLIESDPGVFTELMKGYGVEGIECVELIDLEDMSSVSDALGFIFFLYKCQKEDNIEGSFVQDSRLDKIFFAQQVITNACATQALINILMNCDANKIKLGEILTSLKGFCEGFDANMKGLTISNSDQIRAVHNSFSNSTIFEFDDKFSPKNADSFHFISYIPIENRLYELDGLQVAPLDHGPIEAGTNWVHAACPVIRARMNRYLSSNIHFSLLVLVPERKALYTARLEELTRKKETQGTIIDAESAEMNELREKIAYEHSKMQGYHVENVRRRHNYLPMIITLLSQIAAKGKLTESVDCAVKRTAELKKIRKAKKQSSMEH